MYKREKKNSRDHFIYRVDIGSFFFSYRYFHSLKGACNLVGVLISIQKMSKFQLRTNGIVHILAYFRLYKLQALTINSWIETLHFTGKMKKQNCFTRLHEYCVPPAFIAMTVMEPTIS